MENVASERGLTRITHIYIVLTAFSEMSVGKASSSYPPPSSGFVIIIYDF
jgi:hypothetical protein